MGATGKMIAGAVLVVAGSFMGMPFLGAPMFAGGGTVMFYGFSLFASGMIELGNHPAKPVNYQSVLSTVARLPVVYGKAQVPGHLLYATVSNDGGNLWLVYGLCHGPIAGIDEVFCDGNEAVRADDGTVDHSVRSGRGFITITANSIGVRPTVIAVAGSHDFVDGDTVSILGTSEYDGDWPVIASPYDSGHFAIDFVAAATHGAPGLCRRQNPDYSSKIGFAKYLGHDEDDTVTARGSLGGPSIDSQGFTSSASLLGSQLTAVRPEWASTARSQGVAVLYLLLKYDDQLYHGQLPNVTANVRGKLLYDPRVANLKTVTDATAANPTHVHCAGHGFSAGDLVRIVGYAGAPTLLGEYTVLGTPDGDHFIVGVDLTGGAGTGGGTAAKCVYGTNPVLAYRDMLVNPRYGRGVPDGLIDDGLDPVTLAVSDSYGFRAEAANADSLVLAPQDGWTSRAVSAVYVHTDGTHPNQAYVPNHGLVNGQAIWFRNVGGVAPNLEGPQTVLLVTGDYFTLDDGTGHALVITVGATPNTGTVQQTSQVKQFEMNGLVDCQAELKDRLIAIASSFRGAPSFWDGQYHIFTRRVIPVSYLDSGTQRGIDPDTMVGDWRVRFPRAADKPNVLLTTFINPLKGWQPETFPWPPEDEVNLYLAADNGFRVESRINLPHVTNRYQAERIAQVTLEELRSSVMVEPTCKEEVLKYTVGDLVPLISPSAGWPGPGDPAAGKLFWVADFNISPAGLVQPVLMEYAATAYDLRITNDEAIPLSSALALPWADLAPPTDLRLSTGTSDPRILADWYGTTDKRVWRYEVWAQRIICGDPSVAVDATWRNYGYVNADQVDPAGRLQLFLAVATDGDEWTVQIRAMTRLGKLSDTTSPWSCTATLLVGLIKPAPFTFGVTADSSSVTYTVTFGPKCYRVEGYVREAAASSGYDPTTTPVDHSFTLWAKNTTPVAKAVTTIGIHSGGTPDQLAVTSHGFAVGDYCFLAGTNSTPDVSGWHKVFGVPDSNHFTVDDGTGHVLQITVGGAQPGGAAVTATRASQRVAGTPAYYESAVLIGYTEDGARDDPSIAVVTQIVASGSPPSAAPTSLAAGTPTQTTQPITWNNNGDHVSATRVWVNAVVIHTETPNGVDSQGWTIPALSPGIGYAVAIDHFLNGQASAIDGPVTMTTAAAAVLTDVSLVNEVPGDPAPTCTPHAWDIQTTVSGDDTGYTYDFYGSIGGGGPMLLAANVPGPAPTYTWENNLYYDDAGGTARFWQGRVTMKDPTGAEVMTVGSDPVSKVVKTQVAC